MNKFNQVIKEIVLLLEKKKHTHSVAHTVRVIVKELGLL